MGQAVSFDISRADQRSLTRILKRSRELGMTGGADVVDFVLDLRACHANGCPLNFKRLAEADDFNLAHDVSGIRRHIDRSTGQLTGSFFPRFAA